MSINSGSYRFNGTYKSPVYSRIFKNEMLRSPWLGPLKATIF